MKRHFVKPDFTVTNWDLLKPYFEGLQNRVINSAAELEAWLKDYSELSAVVSEDMAWRYIKMTCDTANTQLRDSYNDFVQNIEPHMAPLSNDLNKKIMDSAFKGSLTKTGYDIYLRGIKNSIDLFREENIPLNTKLQELEQQFGEINGAQSIDYKGEKMTLPQGFDASLVRLTGNIIGSAPFTGTLVHRGWQVTDIRMAKLTQGHNANILAAAEVEL